MPAGASDGRLCRNKQPRNTESCVCPLQATGAIQPGAAAMRRTLLQQGQVGLLLACGLSGVVWLTLSACFLVHGAPSACMMQTHAVTTVLVRWHRSK